MYDIATKTWVECEQLSEPRANVSMATVKVEFLDPEIKFRGDILIEILGELLYLLRNIFSGKRQFKYKFKTSLFNIHPSIL